VTAAFGQRVGAGGRTFARNAHLGVTRERQVVSEVTGMPIGRVIEHGSGRVDAEHNGELTITLTAEQVHGSRSEGRRWLYNWLRESGFTHAQAMRRMTREVR
jgi:hypothetical protein